MFNHKVTTPADVDDMIRQTAAQSRILYGTKTQVTYEELETFCLSLQEVNKTIIKTLHRYFYCVVALLGLDLGTIGAALWIYWYFKL